MEFKYLHRVGPHVLWMDHRVVPEARAMFAAMMSRVPQGGIEARYKEVVNAIAEEIWKETGEGVEAKTDEFGNVRSIKVVLDMQAAEEILTQYPLHPVVQNFFYRFVGLYGHSSVMELVGSPTIFIEHISWWLAYLTFDNPLVRGQEMSTRAVWRKDWPICSDAYDDKDLQEMHQLGLEIAQHEVEAWKAERLAPCPYCENGIYQDSSKPDGAECARCQGTGKKHPDYDPQGAFRFAFDHARWALPGTIETGVAHTADLRTMARVIKVIEDFATDGGQQPALEIIQEIKEAYRQAMPGMAGMGLKEAVYDPQTESNIPGHIYITQSLSAAQEHKNEVRVHQTMKDIKVEITRPFTRANQKNYIDPIFNHYAQVEVSIYCSLAVVRDWHRHRTFYPWRTTIVRSTETGLIKTDPHYEPISEFGKQNYSRYLGMCTDLHKFFLQNGNYYAAMLCLPLGAQIKLEASAGLRDFIYAMELRSRAHGANFEYKEQATEALELALKQLPDYILEYLGYQDGIV